jgi:peptidoglycan hydrolase-like protein with peptidoglycan-binding domain
MSVSGALKKSSLPWVGIEHGGKRLAAAEEIQTYLASRGLYYGKVDGRYGRLTDAAVREYQTKHGITSDGKVGRVTAAIMDAEAAGAPIVAAKPTPQVFPYRNEYQALWDTIAVKPSWNRQIDQRIDYLRRPDHWSEYVKLYKATGVPPQVTAVIHERESSGDLKGVLHNGEAIIGTGKKTKLVPAGHGSTGSTGKQAARRAWPMHWRSSTASAIASTAFPRPICGLELSTMSGANTSVMACSRGPMSTHNSAE